MCYSLWHNVPRMLPAGSLEAEFPGYRPATSWVHYATSCNTQSSAPEYGRVQRPKHVELIGIINKPLLLHIVGIYVYIIYICDAPSKKYQINQILFDDRGVSLFYYYATPYKGCDKYCRLHLFLRCSVKH